MLHILFSVSLAVGKMYSGYKYCLIGFDPLYIINFGIELLNSSLGGQFILWVFLGVLLFVGVTDFSFKTTCPCIYVIGFFINVLFIFGLVSIVCFGHQYCLVD